MKRTILILALLLTAVIVPAASASPTILKRALQHQVAALKAQVRSLKGQLATARSANATLQGQVDSLTTDKNKLTSQVASLTADKNNLTGQVNTLTGQVSTLTGQVNSLTGQVNTLTGERDDARGKLAQAQTGVKGTLGTMKASQIWSLFGDPIASKFNSDVWSKSFFSSGNDYQSWSFTWCGFC